MKILPALAAFISRFLPLWILVLSLIAFLVPKVFGPIQGLTGISLGAIFLIMGMSLSTEQIVSVIKQPKYAFIGVGLKWIVMVTVTVIIAFTFFSNNAELASGIILSGTVPSGTSANIYTFIAGGEVALSITMATLDTVISPVLTPSLVQASVGRVVPVDFMALFMNIIWIVFVPLFIGLFLQWKFPKRVKVITPYTGLLSQLALFVVVLSVISKAEPALRDNMSLLPFVFIAVILQVAIPMFAGFFIPKLLKVPRANMVAITFHTGICNTALSATLAMEHFSSLASVPAVANMIVNLTLGAIVAKVFEKRRPQPEAVTVS